MKVFKKIQPFIKFVREDLWDSDFKQFSRLKKFLIDLLKMSIIVTRGFIDDALPLRSAALTFATILGIVPFLAMMFAILKGFGVHDFFEPFILSKVAAGSREAVSYIFDYISRTNVKSLGAGGLVILVVTVLYVVKNIEQSFNKIWGVKRKRTFFRSFSDYLSIIVIGPVFIFAAVSLTTTVKIEGTVFLERLISSGFFPDSIITLRDIFPKFFRFIPYFFVGFFFTFIYMFMPNTKVKFSSAFIGGTIGALFWQLASAMYINFQFNLGKYNAIYGSLAQLPILLIWIYMSWIIILFGAEISFAFQNLKTFRFESRSLSMSHAYKEALALRISILIARDFQAGSDASAQGISGRLNIPLRLVSEILYELMDSGIFVEAYKKQPVYLPGKDLDNIKLADIVRAIRCFGGGDESGRSTADAKYVRSIGDRIDKSLDDLFSGKTLRQAVSEVY